MTSLKGILLLTSVETHQVGAHIEALNEPILVAASKTVEEFFPFRFPLLDCGSTQLIITTYPSLHYDMLLVNL